MIENTTRENKIIKPLELFCQAAHQVATGYNLIIRAIFFNLKKYIFDFILAKF